MTQPWRVELLGELRAVRADRTVTHFRSRQTGLLLACLAYSQRRYRREELCERLWPEGNPATARTNLRSVLRWLREDLEPLAAAALSPGAASPTAAGPRRDRPPPGPSLVLADRASIWLNSAVTTDVGEFVAALQAARHVTDAKEQERLLVQLVELYAGELLPGYHEDWILQERQWLAEQYFEALEQLLALLEQSGELEQALEYARRGVRADPSREETHCSLMRLLAALGQADAALRQYRELQRSLQEQFDGEPEPVTQALAREIERLALLRPPLSVVPGAGAIPLTSAGAKPPTSEGENRFVTLLAVIIRGAQPANHPPERKNGTALVDRLLQSVVDLVLKSEGRIDRFLGDGALAIFGVPHTHEDDAERAVHTALRIRDIARHLGVALSAAVHTGEVRVGPSGREPHPGALEGDEAIEKVLRLQQQAGAGQILISPACHALTRRAFEFALIPPTTSMPAVYSVERALPHPEKPYGLDGLRADLIGRDEELAKLTVALAALHAGKGQVVTLIGEAGVGKSRLVAELKAVASGQSSVVSGEGHPPLAEIRADNWQLTTGNWQLPLWLEGRCLERAMTTGCSLFLDLLGHYFAWSPEEDDRRRGGRVVTCLRELAAQGLLAEAQVEEIGPLLGYWLSVRFGTDWDDRLRHADGEQLRHRTLVAVRDFLVALSRRQPLVLVCEDLHWADALSLDLLALVLESPSRAPLVLLLLYRPEREHPCWRLRPLAAHKCPEHHSELDLRELTPPQSRAMIASLLGGSLLPEGVQAKLLEQAHGNPLFIEEVVRSLIDAGVLYRAATGTEGRASWQVKPEIEQVPLPGNVQSLIASRVDRLPAELRRVLRSAAVIGRLFRPRVLEKTVASYQWSVASRDTQLTTDNWPLATALWALEEQGLIRQERVVPEREYAFRHVLVQEAIYASLPVEARTALHRQVAEALEAVYVGTLEEHVEQLAYHYERSEAGEKAIGYLLKAGEKAHRAYLNEAAISYFQRALERLDALSEAGSGAASLAESRLAGNPSHAAAAGPLRSARWRLEALTGLGRCYHGTGQEALAEKCFRQALAMGKTIGMPPRALARLHWWLAETLHWQSRFAEALTVGQEGLALLGEDAETLEAALLYDLVGTEHAFCGGWSKRQEYVHRNMGFLRRLPYSKELGVPYSRVVETCLYDDKDDAAAMEWLQALRQAAEEHQDRLALGTVTAYTASILAARGDLGTATSLGQQAVAQFVSIGDRPHEIAAILALANSFLALGKLQEAQQWAETALRALEGTALTWELAWAQMTLGTIYACQGEWERALTALRAADALHRRMATVWKMAEFRAGHYRPIWVYLEYVNFVLARVHLSQAQRSEARQQFAHFLSLAHTTPGPLAATLAGLEESYPDAAAFHAFLARFRADHPGAGDPALVQWYLEPTQPDWGLAMEPVPLLPSAIPEGDWVWVDPCGDSRLTVGPGCEIHAANGRDLWYLNHSAPRLLHPVSQVTAVQTTCRAVTTAKPAAGGLLLWKDKANFLRLDWGILGPHEIFFLGCLGNQEVIIGRGRLPAERVSLRLERVGSRLRASCSADGQHWFAVGQTEFPAHDPIQVGVHAIGAIDRNIYHGAYPEGTAIRFESLQLWSGRGALQRSGGL